MARNGSGVYSLPEAAFVFDTVISETAMNSNLDDIATALTGSIAADGQTTISANLPMNSKKFTGLGVGSNSGDSLNIAQAQGNAYTYQGSDSGAADAYVIALVPSISTQAAGLRVRFVAANASTGASTLNAGGGADAIEYQGAALSGAEIAAGSTIVCEHDGTAWQMTSPSALLSSASGDVVGPASSTDNVWARFNLTTGKIIQDGKWAEDDAGAVDAGGALNMGDKTLQRANLQDYGEITNAIGAAGGGTQDIDLALGNSVSMTIDTSTTTLTYSNPTASDELCGFVCVMTNGGSQTINYPASQDFVGGTSPTWTASGVDVWVNITIDGGTTWMGFVVGLDIQ
jgi:hypothetical protein